MKKRTWISVLLLLCLLMGCAAPQIRETEGNELAGVSLQKLYGSYEEKPLELDSPVFSTDAPSGLYGLTFAGRMGTQNENLMNNWLYMAYYSNPTMIEAFRQRNVERPLSLMAWYGEFPGKYLYSTAMAYSLSKDENLLLVSRELIDALSEVQGADGYLGVFSDESRMLGVVSNQINGSSNSTANWDLWNHYHIIRGLLAWYERTGYAPALDTAVKAGDFILNYFSKDHSLEQVQEADKNLSIVSAFTMLYSQTKDSKYLTFANQILAAWQVSSNCDYYSAGLEEKLFGTLRYNRWEAMHAVLSLADIYEITGDENFKTAFLNLFYSIRDYDRRCSGGVSANERLIATPFTAGAVETCANVTYLELTVRALAMTGDVSLADELELTTLNAGLGSLSRSGRWCTYNTPDEGFRLGSSHELVFQAEPGSPELNCCAVNGPLTMGLLSQWAACSDDSAVTIHYYGAGTAALKTPGGNPLIVTQETDYPAVGSVKLTLSLQQDEEFALKLRIPAWGEGTTVHVNGEAAAAEPGTYCEISRTWHNGDTVELEIAMNVHFMVGQERYADHAAVYYGPVLLALDARYNEEAELSALASCDLSQVVLEPCENGAVPAIPEPMVLLTARFGNGVSYVLCDFAAAGMAGTSYTAWLPVTDTAPVSQETPARRWLAVN